ncbi:MAG: SDR family oxidoreductase [Novosphingobium sp.]|uniref:SDR family oxidoreductase n=1 Tax=Novosphingobium sp. TaxID=1874826 RepID=UPI003019B714
MGQKTIFITGGASGIGRAVAQRFGREGWFVGIADINEDGMAGTAALIPAGFSSQHKLDVRDRAAWDAALADCAAASGGKIDVVFNNAGIPIGGRIIDCSTEEVERTLDINLKGVIFGAQAAYPWLKASAPGSCLLNTASAAGIYGVPGGSIYSATKFGVRSITESLDGEWKEDGIIVRDLMPSFIETPLLDHAPNRASNADIREQVKSAGLEITPVSAVADAAWAAVHGQKVHTLVGKTAKKLAFAARWMPGALRKQVSGLGRPMGG